MVLHCTHNGSGQVYFTFLASCLDIHTVSGILSGHTHRFWHLVWTYTPFLASCLDIHTVSGILSGHTHCFWHLVWTYTLFLRLVYPVIFCFWMSADCFVLHALLLFFAGADTTLLPWWYGSVINNCQGRGKGAFWRDTVDWTVWSTLSSLVL